MKLFELFGFSPRSLYLEQVYIVDATADGSSIQTLEEGKWIDGRFPSNIRIDQPTHLGGDGQAHAHVYGRRGNEIGVVNFDGTPSHGTKCELHPQDANALRGRGFSVRADNMVEWVKVGAVSNVIFG